MECNPGPDKKDKPLSDLSCWSFINGDGAPRASFHKVGRGFRMQPLSLFESWYGGFLGGAACA